MKSVLALLAFVMLASCQSLPERRAPEDRVLAVLVVREGSFISSWAAQTTLSVYPEGRKVPLSDGWNFLRFDPNSSQLWVGDPSMESTKGNGYYAREMASYKIQLPPPGSVVVLPYQFVYFERVAGTGRLLRISIKPLPPEQWAAAQDAWTKANTERKPEGRWDSIAPWNPTP